MFAQFAAAYVVGLLPPMRLVLMPLMTIFPLPLLQRGGRRPLLLLLLFPLGHWYFLQMQMLLLLLPPTLQQVWRF